MIKNFVVFVVFILLIGFSSACIDINSANSEELQEIKGIGPVYAERIIEMRPFENLDRLVDVKGIGEKTLQKIKEQEIVCEDFDDFEDEEKFVENKEVEEKEEKVENIEDENEEKDDKIEDRESKEEEDDEKENKSMAGKKSIDKKPEKNLDKMENEPEVIKLNFNANENVIVLRNENVLNEESDEMGEIIYESKNEKIKGFIPYGFILFLIFLIILFVKDGKDKGNNDY